MANNCDYECRVYGKDKAKVEQFVKAMKYKDLKDGYFMCRIFYANATEIYEDENGIFVCSVDGYCAWSVGECMIDTNYGTWRGMAYGEPHFEVWRDWNGEICYSNIGVTAPMLCKILGVAVEIWSRECGCEFQERFLINDCGEMVVCDKCNWKQGYDTDEVGEFVDLNPEKDEGGFDDYGEYEDPSTLLVKRTLHK